MVTRASKREYKKRLLAQIEELSEPRLRAILDFAAFLKERDEWDASLEILGDEEVMSAIRQSKGAWEAGKTSDFTNLDELAK